MNYFAQKTPAELFNDPFYKIFETKSKCGTIERSLLLDIPRKLGDYFTFPLTICLEKKTARLFNDPFYQT